MKIFELLKNPLIKIPAILLILYFGLFHDKTNPESLGNRLSPDKIKKNFGEMQEKTKYIVVNVHEAQVVAKVKKEGQHSAQDAKVLIKDVEDGSGEQKLECGDVARVSYSIYDQSGKQLEFLASEQLLEGSKNNPIIEENIIGMKQGGIRSFDIPKDFKTDDKKLLQTLQFNGSLKYQVTLLDLKKSVSPNNFCK